MTKTERLQIRIDPALKEKLAEAAQEENRTISNYIEHLIKLDLEKKSGGD